MRTSFGETLFAKQMRLSLMVIHSGHKDGSSCDLDEKHTIKRTVCSGINTSALITRKKAINRAIAGKMI